MQTVELAGLAAAILTAPGKKRTMEVFGARAAEWFGLSSPDAFNTLAAIDKAVKELSSLFKLHTGVRPDIDAIMVMAESGRRM